MTNLKVSNKTKTSELKPSITVIGVGGGGGNAVNNMIRRELEGVEFIVANTDAQALLHSKSERRIQLGSSLTEGLGAGSQSDVGRSAAEEALEQILEELKGSHMVFIVAGMGGGTGTGAAPVIARATKEAGMLTVGVVTKPFQFEGTHRMRLAEAGIEELEQYVDSLIIIPNENLFRIANEHTTFADAFNRADEVLYSGVRGVTDLMVMPGLVNLDFADVRSVMSEMGKAMMGTGEADGDRRALDAAEAAIANPLLDDTSMMGAKGVLINITGGPDITLFEVDEAASRIREEVDQDAYIIFGSAFDSELEGRIRVSVIATGINADAPAVRQSEISALQQSVMRRETVPVASYLQSESYYQEPMFQEVPEEEMEEDEDAKIDKPRLLKRTAVWPATDAGREEIEKDTLLETEVLLAYCNNTLDDREAVAQIRASAECKKWISEHRLLRLLLNSDQTIEISGHIDEKTISRFVDEDLPPDKMQEVEVAISQDLSLLDDYLTTRMEYIAERGIAPPKELVDRVLSELLAQSSQQAEPTEAVGGIKEPTAKTVYCVQCGVSLLSTFTKCPSCGGREFSDQVHGAVNGVPYDEAAAAAALNSQRLGDGSERRESADPHISFSITHPLDQITDNDFVTDKNRDGGAGGIPRYAAPFAIIPPGRRLPVVGAFVAVLLVGVIGIKNMDLIGGPDMAALVVAGLNVDERQLIFRGQKTVRDDRILAMSEQLRAVEDKAVAVVLKLDGGTVEDIIEFHKTPRADKLASLLDRIKQEYTYMLESRVEDTQKMAQECVVSTGDIERCGPWRMVPTANMKIAELPYLPYPFELELIDKVQIEPKLWARLNEKPESPPLIKAGIVFVPKTETELKSGQDGQPEKLRVLYLSMAGKSGHGP